MNSAQMVQNDQTWKFPPLPGPSWVAKQQYEILVTYFIVTNFSKAINNILVDKKEIVTA